ncbi:hypothetical protein PG993_008104 [Apiospora rasikravindrae]|uniref:Uncharacterized protein n=1 Tax=Apiospora rasikravindrae TaxID=990691 RepID=A0ABR1T1Q2_9PEZI
MAAPAAATPAEEGPWAKAGVVAAFFFGAATTLGLAIKAGRWLREWRVRRRVAAAATNAAAAATPAATTATADAAAALRRQMEAIGEAAAIKVVGGLRFRVVSQEGEGGREREREG